MAELVGALAHGREPSSDTIKIVNSAIVRRIAKEFSRVDADAVAQDTMEQLLRSKPNPDNPTAYVFTIARRKALKWLRKNPRVADLDESRTPPDAADDAIAALLARDADRQEVITAMRVLTEAGEHDVVRTVTVWLDLAEQHGHTPPSREVAPHAEVSHTTVTNHLTRLRAIVADLRGES
jgi:hypothetical protein